jgi:AraC-like DNA-binding protein
MKASLEKIQSPPASSFAFRRFEVAGFPFNWHFHPEIELTLIERGRGQRFVGDDISTFSPGDLVLLGSNLPHTWMSESGGRRKRRSASSVIQFRPDFLGPAFFSAAEMQHVKWLLERAGRGLQFSGVVRDRAAAAMMEMADAPPLRRLTLLLESLDRLAGARGGKFLCSAGYAPQVSASQQLRISQVYGWLNQNFTRPIRLSEAAERVHLSESAFTRFFQRATGRRFTEYLNQLRVGRACELMIEHDWKITTIAAEAGFENLSHFNRTFRKLKQMRPREFRRAHR